MSISEVLHGSPTARVYPSAILLSALACVFAIMAGYGWLGESRDYAGYLLVYKNLSASGLPFDARFERGYMWASWVSKIYLGMSFGQFYAFLAATSLALKFRLIWKHASSPVLAALVYLVLLFPLHEYTQIRAAVAFAFAYTAIDEYIDGKLLSAILLFAVAALFHVSALALAVAFALTLLVNGRSPVFAVIIFAAFATFASGIVFALTHVLQEANPLAAAYIEKAYLNTAPTVLSGENLVLIALIASSSILLRPWLREHDKVYFLLGLWTLFSYFALLKIPVFAHRLEEAFIFAFFLFTFRFDASHQSRAPAILMICLGGWMLYEAFSQQLIAV